MSQDTDCGWNESNDEPRWLRLGELPYHGGGVMSRRSVRVPAWRRAVLEQDEDDLGPVSWSPPSITYEDSDFASTMWEG